MQEYEKKKAPFYEKRSKIVPELPRFWLRAMQNHESIIGVVVIGDERGDAAPVLCVHVGRVQDTLEFGDVAPGHAIGAELLDHLEPLHQRPWCASSLRTALLRT